MHRSIVRAAAAASLVAGSVLSGGVASAAPPAVCFGVLTGTTTCTEGSADKVFLVKDSGVGSTANPGLGNIGSQSGSPVSNFLTQSGGLVDLANGYSNITPHSGSSFSTLEFTIPGHTFTTLDFGLEMANNAPLNVTLTAFDGAQTLGSVTYTAASGLRHDSNQDYFVQALGDAVITAVEISTTSGIKEAKQFDVGHVAATAPEPATWAMLTIGFAGLGYAGFRRTKRTDRLA